MSDYRVHVELMVTNTQSKCVKERADIYAQACKKAGMAELAKAGEFKLDRMTHIVLSRLLVDLAPLTNLPDSRSATPPDYLWLRVERVSPNPVEEVTQLCPSPSMARVRASKKT